MRNSIHHFNSSPEVIHLAVMRDIRYPQSLREEEDNLYERGPASTIQSISTRSPFDRGCFAAVAPLIGPNPVNLLMAKSGREVNDEIMAFNWLAKK